MGESSQREVLDSELGDYRFGRQFGSLKVRPISLGFPIPYSPLFLADALPPRNLALGRLPPPQTLVLLLLPPHSTSLEILRHHHQLNGTPKSLRRERLDGRYGLLERIELWLCRRKDVGAVPLVFVHPFLPSLNLARSHRLCILTPLLLSLAIPDHICYTPPSAAYPLSVPPYTRDFFSPSASIPSSLAFSPVVPKRELSRDSNKS